ncbi:MAG: hypothetical protein AABO41_24985 [Acidobacteriota bacterium]
MERDQFRYIADATNDMHRILFETISPGEDDFRKVFAVGCNTLKQVAAQTEVLEDLRNLAMRQEQFWAEYREICGNVDHFVRGFCAIEKKVLIAGGINQSAADSLIKEAIRLRESMKNVKINPDRVLGDLKKLRDEACDIAKHLHDLPSQREEKRKSKKRLQRFFYAIGGTAMVAADAGAFALSLGLSLAGSAVSGCAGSALVGASVYIQ